MTQQSLPGTLQHSRTVAAWAHVAATATLLGLVALFYVTCWPDYAVDGFLQYLSWIGILTGIVPLISRTYMREYTINRRTGEIISSRGHILDSAPVRIWVATILCCVWAAFAGLVKGWGVYWAGLPCFVLMAGLYGHLLGLVYAEKWLGRAPVTDSQRVRAAKTAAVVIGVLAGMCLARSFILLLLAHRESAEGNWLFAIGLTFMFVAFGPYFLADVWEARDKKDRTPPTHRAAEPGATAKR